MATKQELETALSDAQLALLKSIKTANGSQLQHFAEAYSLITTAGKPRGDEPAEKPKMVVGR